MIELDPHWTWVNVQTIGERFPVYIKAECRHLETEPVTLLLTGETVAELCITCDSSFPCPNWIS